jgi:uroporphyrinogen decarboxylase
MTANSFTPDYRNVLDVLHNRRPARLPLYEHAIDPPFISKVIGHQLGIQGNKPADFQDYYRTISTFWKDMTYDSFAYEAAICDILPGHGAINGGMAGPIQTRADFERYPFDEFPDLFWKTYTPHLEAIRAVLPDGMKVWGGCGYGIFETSEDLVGFENLAVMQYLDPELFADLYVKIGELFARLWLEMTKRYSDIFVFFRMGDDIGFKTSTFFEPDVIRQHLIPQYKRVIEIVHAADRKFLLHSCGNIFPVMDDLIGAGIDAKHSNEDQIAVFDEWIKLYAGRIGLFGGIDVNDLCLMPYDEILRMVVEKGTRFRNSSRGFGLGSGNSIAGYIPVEGFLAMVEGARIIRDNAAR